LRTLGRRSFSEGALTDLDAVAGGIADKEAREAFGGAAFFDRCLVARHSLTGRIEVFDEETDMAPAQRPLDILKADMKLGVAGLEPGATARAQLRRLGDFEEAKHLAIEGQHHGLFGARDRNVDVVEGGDAKGHDSLRPCKGNPGLLAKPPPSNKRPCARPMSVDKNTVKRVAKLARLAFPEERLEAMAGELNRILAWVEQLNEVDTSAVEPMTSVVKMHLKMREDKVTDGGQAVAVTQNAPQGEDHFFAVPKVVE